MNDPEWRRIVIIRDPALRLLSGYLNKLNGHQPKGFDYNGLNPKATFAEMVEYLEKEVREGKVLTVLVVIL